MHPAASEILREAGGRLGYNCAAKIPGDMMEPVSTLFETAAAATPADDVYTTGILPAQELLQLVHVTKQIRALEPILDDQIQPASIDLRLGSTAYRVRASFLPGLNSTVQEKLREFTMHEMDI